MGLFGSRAERLAKRTAKQVGLPWSQVYWAAFTTPVGEQASVLLVTMDEVVYGASRLPLAGASASVDTGEMVEAPEAGGVKPPMAADQVVLTVDGRSTSIVIALGSADRAAADRVARSINALATEAAALMSEASADGSGPKYVHRPSPLPARDPGADDGSKAKRPRLLRGL
jgi:hypothetical protein